MVSCAVDVADRSSLVRAGRTGRDRSIEIGPKTVSRLRTTASARATRCCTGAVWTAAMEVVTGTRERASADAWQGRVIRVLAGPSYAALPAVAWIAWTTGPRCASFSPR